MGFGERERERGRAYSESDFHFFEVGVPAGCLLIRFVFFSGLLQNMSKWRVVCMGKGMWDFVTLDFGLGCWEAKAKTKWTHLCMDGQTQGSLLGSLQWKSSAHDLDN